MFSASLNVERHKIQTKPISRFLKQMVGHLPRDGVIKCLGHLVDQSQGVAVKPSSLEEVIRLLQHLRQLLGANKLVTVAPPLNCAGQQGVAKPEKCILMITVLDDYLRIKSG